jgi:hypothetical protein
MWERDGEKGDGAYKKPKLKMHRSIILDGLASCRDHIAGRGKANTAISVMMLPAALMYHCGMLGMHVEGMLESQKPETGLHVKMPTNTCDRAQPPTTTMLAIYMFLILCTASTR